MDLKVRRLEKFAPCELETMLHDRMDLGFY
jgi:hypothetical protein